LLLENPVILRHILKVLFILLAFSHLTEAQIVVSDTADCAPFTDVQFNSIAGVGDWDFGDGTSAINTDSAKHTFSQPGNYSVTFSQGGNIVDTQEIIVFGNPNPKFTLTGDSSGCIPFTVPFVDQSTGDGTSNIVDWQWTFGDGGASNAQNPSYTYSLVGAFTVSLIVTDDNGCDSAHVVPKLISTSTPPTASFSNSILTSCSAPLIVSFTNNSINSTAGTTELTYEWDFGGGVTSTDQNPADVTYSSEGPITITLKVTEDGGCSHTTTRTGNIGKPTAIIAIPDTICINAPHQFINNSLGGSSWNWLFSDGASSAQNNPTKTFNTAGIHTATLTATQSGCSDDTTVSFFVQEIIPNFTINPTYLCEEPWCFQMIETTSGGADTFVWTFDDGSPAGNGDTVDHCYTLDTNIYTVYDPIVYDVTLFTSSKWGCLAQIQLQDTIYPVSAFFSPDTAQGCAPLTIAFSDSTRSRESIVSWEWDFSDGSTSTSQNPTHTYSDTGHFTVVLIAENSIGCKDTSYRVMIDVGEKIALDFSIAPTTVCLGDSVTFTDISGSTEIDYWHFGTDDGRSGSCPDQNSQSWTYNNETGLHDVTFSANINGCISDTTVANAVEVQGPSSKFFYNGHCETPFLYSFEATLSDVESFTWDFGDGTVINSVDVNNTFINHTYAATGDYTVYLISQNATSGCSNDTDSLVVHVREIYAEITGDTILCSGLTYIFSSANSIDNNNSCNDGFRWDLGDGSQPTIKAGTSHSYQFADTGVYEIRMITKDINLCYDTAYREVRVARIDVGFSLTPAKGCLPLIVNFTDTSYSDTLFTKWDWTFGNGTTSNLQNPTVTYTSTSTNQYEIILTATDSLGCIDADTAYVNPTIPDTNFVVNDRTLCIDDSALFTLSGGAQIATADWNFGDGGTSSDLNPWHTFNTAGDFTITVTVTDTNGCVGTKTRATYVEVDDYPEALFMTNVDTNSVICYPVQINFTDTSIVNTFGSRVWDLGVPNPILPNTTVSWSYDQPGIYSTSLIERTSNGCADTLKKTFEIIGPIATFDLSRSSICVGEEITFTMKDSADVETFLWDFGDGTSQSAIDPITHKFTEVPNGGTTNVQLIIWSEDSVCDFVTVKPVAIHEVEARFEFVDSTICDNEQAQFTNNSIGATSYLWNFQNGSTSTVKNPTDQNYGTIGKYDVSLIIEDNINGCVDTLIKELEVLPRPIVTATATAMCFGDSALVQASGANTYTWDNTDMVDDPTSISTWAFPPQTTTFTVTGTDTNNCINTAPVEVKVLLEPINQLIDTCYIIGDMITLGKDYGSSYMYDWTIGETSYLTCEKCASQVIQIKDEHEDPISFIVEYRDTLGCFVSQDEYRICILDKYTVDVPSAFTPNGAGENDVIYLNGHGIEEFFYFRIYNRWGELIFETNDINVGWDGTYKGQAQNMETYIYQAKVLFYNGEFEEKGGSITLIR
jgi:gliding motility-associated-like protein